VAKKSAVSEYLAKIGQRGGKARLQSMTPEERAALARKAGEASGRARAAKKQKQDAPKQQRSQTKGAQKKKK
jgi:general stress protein YciG